MTDWIEDKPLTGSEVWSTACFANAGRPGDQRENLMFSSTEFIKVGLRTNANCQAQFALFVEAFREMFNLLEEYAPTWYTEAHHNRAVDALRGLEESRQPAHAEAVRAQKAGK